MMQAETLAVSCFLSGDSFVAKPVLDSSLPLSPSYFSPDLRKSTILDKLDLIEIESLFLLQMKVIHVINNR